MGNVGESGPRVHDPAARLAAQSRFPTPSGAGMWGITLGPVTGRLLAEAIVTGRNPPELAPLDPLR